MKSYSVKEIAEMFNTNPETVRRWIRTGRLEASLESRKGGNVVTESMLRAFLKESPKYAGVAASLITNPVGVTVTAATLLGGILTHQHIKNEQLKNAQVNTNEIIKLLKTDIASRKSSIKRKQEAISQLQRELAEENQHIEEAKHLIEELAYIKIE